MADRCWRRSSRSRHQRDGASAGGADHREDTHDGEGATQDDGHELSSTDHQGDLDGTSAVFLLLGNYQAPQSKQQQCDRSGDT